MGTIITENQKDCPRILTSKKFSLLLLFVLPSDVVGMAGGLGVWVLWLGVVGAYSPHTLAGSDPAVLVSTHQQLTCRKQVSYLFGTSNMGGGGVARVVWWWLPPRYKKS